MQPAPPPLTPAAAKALEGLADISTPAPVSWMPQTWGWAVLAIGLLAVTAWALWRWQRHREANRYRTEALAALAQLPTALDDPRARAETLTAVGVLLKRTALAAFHRDQVAELSGPRWAGFLGEQVRSGVSKDVAAVLDDLEYRGPAALGAVTADQAREVVNAARHWIKEHRVPA
jgi:hypothetical protein